MVTVPTSIFPVSERFINLGRESVTPAVAATSYVTVPVTSFLPDDKPIWIPDEAWRASMAMEYDLLQGPIWTETTFGGPAYGDTIGHLFYNILGDNVATGTGQGTITTTLNHSGGYAAGTSGTITVTSGGGFTSSSYVQIDTGGNAEIVQITAGGATDIVISASTPTRFAHTQSAIVTQVVAPFTNGFGLLNGGNGQPPSHTFVDRTQIPGSGNNNAVQYLYGCLSELELTGNAKGILTYTANMASYSHSYPGSPPVASISAVRATPVWRSLLALGGTIPTFEVNDIAEWKLKLTRVVEPIPTNDGTQSPFVIARGKFSATCALTFMPTLDETELNYMLNNTQPQLQIQLNNGFASTSASFIQYTIDAQLAAFDTAKINESSALFGYDVTSKLIANTTNSSGTDVTNSGSYSPLHISLVNAVPVY